MDEVHEGPRQQLLFAVAEHAVPRRIDALEVAVESRDAEHVEREREEAIELLLRAPPFDEQPDLVADAREHREQILVGRADLAAEELHHAEHFAARAGSGIRMPRAGLRGPRRARAESSCRGRRRGSRRADRWPRRGPAGPRRERTSRLRLMAWNSGKWAEAAVQICAQRRTSALAIDGPERAVLPVRAPRRWPRGSSARLRRTWTLRPAPAQSTCSAVSRRSASPLPLSARAWGAIWKSGDYSAGWPARRRVSCSIRVTFRPDQVLRHAEGGVAGSRPRPGSSCSAAHA